MMQNFDKMIQEKADRVFTAMGQRVSREDVTRIQEAFELARIEDETLEKDIVLKIYARLTNVFREKLRHTQLHRLTKGERVSEFSRATALRLRQLGRSA